MRLPLTFFLTAKHWQLFALFVGAVFIVQFMMFANVRTSSSPEAIQRVIGQFMVVTILLMSGFLAWLWALGRILWSQGPPELRLNITRFKWALIYPALYSLVFAFIMHSVMEPPAWIFPLHFLAMFCMFYNLYFVAKSLEIVEKRLPLDFYGYSGAFFLLWFFPIGIWVIQPRINRLYARQLAKADASQR